MPRRPTAKAQPLQPLTPLQKQAAALLADGCSDERVAAELAVPLDWVEEVSQALPVAAEVVSNQWRKYQAHGQRIRSLVEQAMEVVEAELVERPTPELALAILKTLKVEAPEVHRLSAPEMLRAQCVQDAEQEVRDEEESRGLSYGFVSDADKNRKARQLFEERAHLLSAPADPEADA
jgi:transposase-like protein